LVTQLCRMHNSRKIKELMFGRMEFTKKRGRPHREWLDDATECPIHGDTPGAEPSSDGQNELVELGEAVRRTKQRYNRANR